MGPGVGDRKDVGGVGIFFCSDNYTTEVVGTRDPKVSTHGTTFPGKGPRVLVSVREEGPRLVESLPSLRTTGRL